jgi:hypothetical protein
LILNTGASAEILKSPTAFLDFVIDVIATQEGTFATVDPKLLAEAAADQITITPRAVTHRAEITAKVDQASLQPSTVRSS